METTEIKKAFERKVNSFNTHFTSFTDICKRVIEQKMKYDDLEKDKVYISLLSVEDLHKKTSMSNDGVRKFMAMFERYLDRNSSNLLSSETYQNTVKYSILYMADETDSTKSHLLKYNINLSTILEYANHISNQEKESVKQLGLDYISSDPESQFILASPIIIIINLYRILHTITNDENIKCKLRMILNPLEEKAGYTNKTLNEESFADSFSTIYQKLRGGIEALPFISEEQKKKIPDSNRIGSIINNVINSEGTQKFTKNLFDAFESGKLSEMSKSMINKLVEESNLGEGKDQTTKDLLELVSPLITELNFNSETSSTSEKMEAVTEDD